MEHRTMMSYSMQQLIEDGVTSKEDFIEAFQKALEVCSYAGINPADHFRQVYAYDTETGMMYTDWVMSRKGLRLIIMQYPHQAGE